MMLTDQEIDIIIRRHWGDTSIARASVKGFARAVLAAAQAKPDPVVMQYLALTEAMGYPGPDTSDMSPEEWAEKLVATAQAKSGPAVARKPLTDGQIEEMALQEQFLLVCDGIDELTAIVRATEAALKGTP